LTDANICLRIDVGLIVGLEDHSLLDEYFASFMLPAKDGGYAGSKVEKVLPPDWSKVEKQEVSHNRAVFANGDTTAGGKALEA
jgi:phenol 2-monooxygenase